MLDMIKSPDDVIALKIGQHISGDELNTVMDRLDAALAAHAKVHVFVETHAIEGIEAASLMPYLARAFPLFGKLGQFDRIAVVADQSWVRVASKMESMMLPKISYRVFEPDQRDAAFTWVTTGVDIAA